MYPSFTSLSDRHEKEKSLIQKLQMERSISKRSSEMYASANWNGLKLISLDDPPKSALSLSTVSSSTQTDPVFFPTMGPHDRSFGTNPPNGDNGTYGTRVSMATMGTQATPSIGTIGTQTRPSVGDRSIQTDRKTYGVIETQTDPIVPSENDPLFSDLFNVIKQQKAHIDELQRTSQREYKQALEEFNALSNAHTMTKRTLRTLTNDFQHATNVYHDLKREHDQVISSKNASQQELQDLQKEFIKQNEYLDLLSTAYEALRSESQLTEQQLLQTIKGLEQAGAEKTAEILSLYEHLNAKQAVPLDKAHITDDMAKKEIEKLFDPNRNEYAKDLIDEHILPFKRTTKKKATGAYFGENGKLLLTKQNSSKNLPTEIDWQRTYLDILQILERIQSHEMADIEEEKPDVVMKEETKIKQEFDDDMPSPNSQDEAEQLVCKYLNIDDPKYGRQYARFLLNEKFNPVRLKKSKNGETLYTEVVLGPRGSLKKIRNDSSRAPARKNIDWIRTLDDMKAEINDKVGSPIAKPKYMMLDSNESFGLGFKGGRVGKGRFNNLLYKTVGARKVHLPSLQKGYLSVRHMNGTMAGRKTKIDDQLLRLIKTFVFEDHIDQELYDSLDVDDQTIFSELLRATRIQNTLKDGWKNPKEALKARFDKLQGEVELGNDSVLPELKKTLVDMFSQNMISDKQFKELFEHLL